MFKNILKTYTFIAVTLMGVAGFLSVTSYSHIISALLFYPLVVYMWMQIIPKSKKAIPIEVNNNSIEKAVEESVELTLEDEIVDPKIDADRRAFIKLIGSAGLSVFMLSLVTKRAQAAFFGSVPGPGVVALKDSSGNQIDPAEKHPTDGYRVVQLDDGTTSYYGFQNKDGAWFIMQEDASGNYRYAKGSSDFTNATTGWPNRASLTYDYFESVF